MYQHARCLHLLLQDHQGRKYLANHLKNPYLRRPMKEGGIKNGLPCPSKEGNIDSSSLQRGRNPHGRFYKEWRNAPSPPYDPPSLDDTLLSSSDDSFSSSFMEERRKKKKKKSHDHHKRKAMAMKKKHKKRQQKFREGSKNVSFITYDGTYGAIDKFLAFV